MNEQLQWSGKGKMSPGWNKREKLCSGKHHTDVSFSQFYEHNVLWPQNTVGKLPVQRFMEEFPSFFLHLTFNYIDLWWQAAAGCFL